MSEKRQQKLLDKSVKHVITQGKPAGFFDHFGEFKCKYKDANNLKCAAGIFIIDFTHKMDNDNGNGMSWKTVCENFSSNITSDSFKEKDFVNNVLQCAHDTAASNYKSKRKSFTVYYKSIIKKLVKEWNEEHNTNLKVNF